MPIWLHLVQGTQSLAPALVLRGEGRDGVTRHLVIRSFDRRSVQIDDDFGNIHARIIESSDTVEVQAVVGIVRVASTPYLVVAVTAENAAEVCEARIHRITGVEMFPIGVAASIPKTGYSLQRVWKSDAPPALAELQSLLLSGFYYSYRYNLLRSLQDDDRARREGVYTEGAPLHVRADEKFFWNKHLLADMLAADVDAWWILPITQGFAQTVKLAAAPHEVLLTLISRRSCVRAGTRFNCRGNDDEGNSANSVETEQLLIVRGSTVHSYTQLRGSCPVFWDQAMQVGGGGKPVLTRGHEATSPAFKRHFDSLKERYGAPHVINLLSTTKDNELILSAAYEYQTSELVHKCPSMHLGYTAYDFHNETKGRYEVAESFVNGLEDTLLEQDRFITTLSPAGHGAVLECENSVRQQRGIFRTSCLDCLDRTNVVQSYLGRMRLEADLRGIGLLPRAGGQLSGYATADALFGKIWANNGDALSLQYAGSGGSTTAFTRGKRGLMQAVDGAHKSVARFYVNTFRDGDRQMAIDLLLGKASVTTAPDSSTISADRRSPMSLVVATYNVNARGPNTANAVESLREWLRIDGRARADVYAVGFQEIVPLTASQVAITTNTASCRAWESALLTALNGERGHLPGDEEGEASYALVCSRQLVGVHLCIFVVRAHLGRVRNVITTDVKVGVMGMGNKGAVGIRLEFDLSSVCFVCAHLAAGQDKVEDRNNDYAEVTRTMEFRPRLGIPHHEFVFWLGDFNYRVSMPSPSARALVKDALRHRDAMQSLLACDQLREQRRLGRVFRGFEEGPITFLPTYKFDTGTLVYDTSEKQRTPAWTDRVLWKSSRNVKQRWYASAPLVISDHQPVAAEFVVRVAGASAHRARQRSGAIKADEEGSTAAPVVESRPPPPSDAAPPPPAAMFMDLLSLGPVADAQQESASDAPAFTEDSVDPEGWPSSSWADDGGPGGDDWPVSIDVGPAAGGTAWPADAQPWASEANAQPWASEQAGGTTVNPFGDVSTGRSLADDWPSSPATSELWPSATPPLADLWAPAAGPPQQPAHVQGWAQGRASGASADSEKEVNPWTHSAPASAWPEHRSNHGTTWPVEGSAGHLPPPLLNAGAQNTDLTLTTNVESERDPLRSLDPFSRKGS